ncbi:hypothetical protein HYZ97_00200 [Candidatus Pacearchaeota archaeon]|nr:hypothetical protein [Candidatus Pacearchaeota archaeon]
MYRQEAIPIVEAIDEGKIVRVPEDYARREGLPIIRRPVIRVVPAPQTEQTRAKERGLLRFEEFSKPLKHDTKTIESELAHNFHWIILKKRKERGVTRKQLAQSLAVDEYALKMLENGVVVGGNFVLVNKVEQFFNIDLRKDTGKPITPPAVEPAVQKENILADDASKAL